jgi:Terminase DNA packaging enzyme
MNNDDKISAEEKLSKILDIEISESKEFKKIDNFVKEVKIKRKDQIRQDFDSARKNMKDLISSGFEALDGIMKVAEAGDSPRAYEVASILMKTVSEINTDLMNMHKTTADALGTNKIVKNTTNNSIFVGSTRDLQNIINQSRSQLKAITEQETLEHDS